MHDRWAGITAGMILSAVFLHPQAAEGHGYDYNKVETQPATESLDLGAYARIREEGFNHSHIMEYASALFDDIGPRLTGSPNLAKANAWTRDQLTAMGCVNAHLEDWGEFGLGWPHPNTRGRLAAPHTQAFAA